MGLLIAPRCVSGRRGVAYIDMIKLSNQFHVLLHQNLNARQRQGQSGLPCAFVSAKSDNNSAYRSNGMRSLSLPYHCICRHFLPPFRFNNWGNSRKIYTGLGGRIRSDVSTNECFKKLCGPDGQLPQKLRYLDPRLIERVQNEIMDQNLNVLWDDIAGLNHAKKAVNEMVIWPLLRPDLFEGCCYPGGGLLLFGPPGTGKTMIGKAIAGEAKATFFNISPSSLTSNLVGENEQLVRALFGVASCLQPAIIFVDEIDSLLSKRGSNIEPSWMRRFKTQFLIEMDGIGCGNEQILVIGATNRPQDIDEAARRRFCERLYIPLPSSEARAYIICRLLENDELFKLSKADIDIICQLTEGYSGSDLKNLVRDASKGPLREVLSQGTEITNMKAEDLRSKSLQDFKNALQTVRPSLSSKEVGTYDQWNQQFGSLNWGNSLRVYTGSAGKISDVSTNRCFEKLCGPDGKLPQKLRYLEPRLIECVQNEIMDQNLNVLWDDIAGLNHAKKAVNEMVIWPLLRPDIFKGGCYPGRGLLLFGPPGTGKTMIGKAIAGEAKATFFNISPSSLTSRSVGEYEQIVRGLFGVASCLQPAIIFIDEIDSLLSKRGSIIEPSWMRRFKTQFLIEMDGIGCGNEQILVIGATNRPQDLDVAACRRFSKRLYIPLPSSEARAYIIRHLLEKDELFKLSKEDIDIICLLTEGYSGSDLKNLVRDASMGPVREVLSQGTEITNVKAEDLRSICLQDFKNALQMVRASVSAEQVVTYDKWNQQFGGSISSVIIDSTIHAI